MLALDGGGIRGIFTVEILARIEELLRQHLGRPNLVLADHFDLIAGTSTGAIIASFLAWGEPTSRIRELYLRDAGRAFIRAPFWRLNRGWFDERQLSRSLREFFVEDDSGTPALLGSQRIRSRLVLVMRNATTGSDWPVTNNPEAQFNLRTLPDGSPNPECNLDIPLWRLVRASAAAPVYFPPESIDLGNHRFEFMDGAITAYNNPALIAFLIATLPSFRLQWPTGVERLHLVSIGTCQTRAYVSERLRRLISFLSYAAVVPSGLMDSISREQDLLCRTLGKCLYGAPINSEIGDLLHDESAPKRFSYVRYNREFSRAEVTELEDRFDGGLSLDNVQLAGFLRDTGKAYSECVKLEHLL